MANTVHADVTIRIANQARVVKRKVLPVPAFQALRVIGVGVQTGTAESTRPINANFARTTRNAWIFKIAVVVEAGTRLADMALVRLGNEVGIFRAWDTGHLFVIGLQVPSDKRVSVTDQAWRPVQRNCVQRTLVATCQPIVGLATRRAGDARGTNC